MTRQISMTTRKELLAALQLRYSSTAFGDRIKILDEFVALTALVQIGSVDRLKYIAQ